MLLNDSQAYDLLLSKMKGLMIMQKHFKSNNMISRADTDIGLLLVNAVDEDFGKILMANHVLFSVLGYSSQEVKHARISVIQP